MGGGFRVRVSVTEPCFLFGNELSTTCPLLGLVQNRSNRPPFLVTILVYFTVLFSNIASDGIVVKFRRGSKRFELDVSLTSVPHGSNGYGILCLSQ